jgi:hypothetical protein
MSTGLGRAHTILPTLEHRPPLVPRYPSGAFGSLRYYGKAAALRRAAPASGDYPPHRASRWSALRGQPCRGTFVSRRLLGLRPASRRATHSPAGHRGAPVRQISLTLICAHPRRRLFPVHSEVDRYVRREKQAHTSTSSCVPAAHSATWLVMPPFGHVGLEASISSPQDQRPHSVERQSYVVPYYPGCAAVSRCCTARLAPARASASE